MGLKQTEEQKNTQRLNVLTDKSDRKGLLGLVETFLRKFRNLAFFALLVPVFFLCCFSIGISTVPSIYIIKSVWNLSLHWLEPIRFIALGISFAAGYFAYGISLIFVVPAINFIVPLRVKPWKGINHSLQAIPWYIHNALTYMVRYTFLELATPTPLNVLFYRMMGMKIGKGVIINTTNISDPCLITLEDDVFVGGSAHLLAHYGQKGILVLSPVTIKKGASIGLKASVMGGVTVGERAIVKPHTVLLPKENVPAGATV